LKYAMLIDIDRCSLCFACVVACKDEFIGNSYPPYSRPQPDRGHEWIRLQETEKGMYPHVKVYPTPVLCMHCKNAPCAEACPIEGAIYRDKNGVVMIDPAICDGCKACMKACPYNVIFFNDDAAIAQKCTLCSHRLQEGKTPACVDSCPSDVFFFGEESKVMEEIKKRKASVMSPEFGTNPIIYYTGLPSISLAGHLIDAGTLMDIPGASVSTTESGAKKTARVKSNLSGVFLIEDLKQDRSYSLKMELPGYAPRALTIKPKIEYTHLGDVKLTRA
jgi:tetrathionate reductase subunit B